jgi:hypothetical protein
LSIFHDYTALLHIRKQFSSKICFGQVPGGMLGEPQLNRVHELLFAFIAGLMDVPGGLDKPVLKLVQINTPCQKGRQFLTNRRPANHEPTSYFYNTHRRGRNAAKIQ